jgi:hypothetical protein
MSEFEDSSGQATLGVQNAVPSALMELLACDGIAPGMSPSYEICKTIYAYHPLGAKMAEAPIKRAQSQPRKITVTGGPEADLVEAFEKEWERIGVVGADTMIRNVHALSRVYGIAAVAMLCDDIPVNEPLPWDRIHELELSFNILDPLNTAGSLVLEQDPNKSSFLKPVAVSVAGKPYHPSRTAIVMNEQPIYIEWTNSAFGFVGRSVYQRALFPLKSYVLSMITDNSVTEKAGLLVMKMKSPGSIIDKTVRAFYSMKRLVLRGAKTGNVLSIGTEEEVESVDLKNLKDAAEFARNNILKNIATAADMPASLINQETLAEGFGEGSEDAKEIAGFVAGIRKEADPIYRFFDNLVMRRAWNPKFYEALQRKYSELAEVPYDTAFYDWKNAFKAVWPNLLVEPDSEKVKTDDVVTKAAIAAFEVLAPAMDPENKARLAGWLADVFNSRETFARTPMNIDIEAMENYEPPAPPPAEPKPVVESSHE